MGRIDYRALDFHDVRRRNKDNDFQFEACDFLLERLPGGRRKTKNAQQATAKSATQAKPAGGKPEGNAERNPQSVVYDRNSSER